MQGLQGGQQLQAAGHQLKHGSSYWGPRLPPHLSEVALRRITRHTAAVDTVSGRCHKGERARRIGDASCTPTLLGSLCDTAQLGHRRAADIVRDLRVPMSCPVALARSTAAGPGADLCTKTDNSYCVPDELEAAWDSPGHQQPAGCGARSPAGRRTSHAAS